MHLQVDRILAGPTCRHAAKTLEIELHLHHENMCNIVKIN